MTKVIIFDFDGTLGDTRQNIVITLQRTMRDLNLELRDEATCAATIGLTLRDSFLSMYPDMSGADADRCVEYYRKIFYDSIEELTPRPFENVVSTLDRLYVSFIGKESICMLDGHGADSGFLCQIAFGGQFCVVRIVFADNIIPELLV